MPLTLRIRAFFPHPAIEAMVSHSNRWKNVEIETSHEVLVTMLFSSKATPWPLSQLERLLIKINTDYHRESSSDRQRLPEGYNPEDSPCLDGLEHTPALKELHLEAMNVSQFEFSWPQLRNLTLDTSINVVRVQEILEQCSSLERLTLHVVIKLGDDEDDEDYLNESPNTPLHKALEFPKLTYLSVELYYSDRILTQLRAPSLRELIVKSTTQLSHLASFLRTSGGHIKRLELEEFAIKDADPLQLGPAFSHLSNLESLSVSFADDDDDDDDGYDPQPGLWGPEAVCQLLDVLTFRRDLAVAPNLGTLVLDGADIVEPGSFIKMMSSRIHSSRPDAHLPNAYLTSVQVTTMFRYTRKLFTKKNMARLKKLTRGMQKFSLEDGESAKSDREDPESEEEPMTPRELARLKRTWGLGPEEFGSNTKFPDGFWD